jgi:folate-binding protein YgfZ
MLSPNFTELTNRALVRISGRDAGDFLQGLVTCEVMSLKTGEINFGALLTPQGKILFDFFVIAMTEGFMIDIDASMAEDFSRRLIFYRLRAAVDIEPMDPRTSVFAIWGGDDKGSETVVDGLFMTDPRLAAMGKRAYLRRAPAGSQLKPLADWNDHRIQLGMPEGGLDFVFGTTFPHEALMDQFKGVDFQKGCYVGQEVVSRMQHRSTARKRLIQINANNGLPSSGAEIVYQGKSCGEITSTSNLAGSAMIRLDRITKEEGDPVALAGSIAITLHIPDWCNFGWPSSDEK